MKNPAGSTGDPETPQQRPEDQPLLFDVPADWQKEWRGMPEFEQEDLTPVQSVLVHFKSVEDRAAFSRLVAQTVTDKTKSLWYPKADIGRFADKRFAAAETVNPRYPVYIVSKGRWEKRLTSDHLHRMGVAHFIIVEEQELASYAAVVSPLTTLLVLDKRYQRDYDIFEDVGGVSGTGSGPARNFAWDHAAAAGAARHWTVDDNIDGFYRLHNNLKTPATTGAVFRAMEDFCDRYENVAMAGPNYFMFASRKSVMPPFVLNTRIYSCNLIKTDAPYRWRGRYNEDTDLSLRMLKDGWCTVLFNAFLQFKSTTLTMKGGNTDTIYVNGTRAKSEMLARMHPDVARVAWKFGRWHHHVNYGPFKRNELRLREGVSINDGADNYRMALIIDEPTR